MKYLLLLFIPIFTGCYSTKIMKDIKCLSLTINKETKYLNNMNTDYNFIKAEWLSKEIIKDSISIWINKYSDSISTLLTQDGLGNRNILKANWDKNLASRMNDILVDYKQGDRIIYYTTPKDMWTSLAGQDGVVLLRKCKIITYFILWQS